MTGSLKIKKTSAGHEYYYIHLSYKDPLTNKWKTKDVKTGLQTKGNKKKAESLIDQYVQKYSDLEQISDTSPEIDPDIELCDFLDVWIKKKACEICGNTLDTYQSHVRSIKQYFFDSHIILRNLTSNIVDDYFHYCLQYGKISQKDGSRSPLSVRTVRDYRTVLQAALDDAVMKGIIPTNPVRTVKVTNKRNKDFAEELLFLEEDEIRKMLVYLEKHDPFLKPIAFIGVYYGMRREEILGLKWSDIDFEGKTITVRHTRTGNTTIYEMDKTKTKEGRRTLDLFPTAELCLRKVQQEQEENRKFFGNAYNNTHDYVFTAEDGTPYRPDHITKTFSKAMDDFGRPEITLHKLRYTFISLMIDKGWDIKKIQYWVGDADASTVMNIYAQYMKFKENRASRDLAEISANVADLFEQSA